MKRFFFYYLFLFGASVLFTDCSKKGYQETKDFTQIPAWSCLDTIPGVHNNYLITDSDQFKQAFACQKANSIPSMDLTTQSLIINNIEYKTEWEFIKEIKVYIDRDNKKIRVKLYIDEGAHHSGLYYPVGLIIPKVSSDFKVEMVRHRILAIHR